MRQALLGVFLGFVLIDLVFDLESIDGNFDAPTSFYIHRNETISPTRTMILLQIPLLSTLLFQVIGVIKARSWQSILSLILTLGAMFGGNHVIGLRGQMNTGNTTLLHAQLVEVAWTHVIMLPLLLGAIFLTRNQPCTKTKLKSQ